MTKSEATIAFMILLAGCRPNPYDEMSDQEIHAKARQLPLEERYAFYLQVLDSRIPDRPDVADDLVLLGEPARKYVTAQAVKGTRRDLLNALPALSAFRGKCTPEEFQQLSTKARSVADNPSDLRLINRHIDVACEIAAPPGYKVDFDNRDERRPGLR